MFIPRILLLVFLFAFAAFSPLQSLSAKTIYVDAANGASAVSPYGTWASAAATLQDAIGVSGAGDEIWVAAGTYYPDEGGTEINDNRYASFSIRDRVALYGGFTGTETDLSAANPSVNVTILSGEIQKDNEIANNSYHVIQASFLEADTILQGFKIEGGNANGPDPAIDQRGGGILCSFSSLQIINCRFFNNHGDRGGAICIFNQSSPTITDCSFSTNTASFGGAIHNDDSSPSLTGCDFTVNEVTSYGGAIHNFNSSNPVIADCSFAENRAAFGGAMLNESSAPSVTDCSFESNTATTNGGGVHNFSGSSPSYTRCSFQRNTATTTGGGMINYINSSPTLTNCSFKGNEAQYAGALVNDVGSSPVIKSCVFAGNFANIRGGAIVNQNSCEPDFTNCSFQGNRSGADGGAIFNATSCVTSLLNCIIGINSANSSQSGQSASVFNQTGGSMTYQFCMVSSYTQIDLNANGASSGNNLSYLDPLFGNAPNPSAAPSIDGDLRLRSGSPLIDIGSLVPIFSPEDLAGNPRVQNGRIDLGAYEGFAVELEYLYNIQGETVTITGYLGDETTVIIPDTLDDLPVTQIGNFAFAGLTNLTSVTIPESVTSIGIAVFSGCSSLTGIEVSPGNPNYSAENGVLFFTSGDQFILLACPEGKAGSYSTPDNVTSIGTSAFNGCRNLTSITLPEGLTSIGNVTFSGCSSLTSITLPEGVTSIGTSAFDGCSSLTSITLPESVISIGTRAFSFCRSLTSITLPEGLTLIENSTFGGCLSLTSVTIPRSVTSIGNFVFFDCPSLISITLPDGVTSIGASTFQNCSNLVEVSFIGNAPTLSGTGQFDGLPSEAKVFYRQGATGWEATYGGLATQEVTLFEFIGTTNVTITGYVGNDTIVIIPDTLNGAPVIQFGLNVFTNRTDLIHVTLPGSLRSIVGNTFENCTSLTSVTIPEGPTSIGAWTFSGCSSLTSITLPESITSIGFRTFQNCSSLASVTLPQNLTSILGGTFENCSSLTSVTLPEGLTSIGNTVFSGCSNLNSITLPEGLTSIGSGTFENCSSLIRITIPEGVTSIGDAAFQDCSNLTSVTIPEGVTSIGAYTFLGCSSLTSVTLPRSVTSIGVQAFQGCRSLVEVSFLGNAPALVGTGHFSGLPPEARVYYRQGSTGWGATFGGLTTVAVELTYSEWIADYPGVGAETGYNDDPDGDGVPNGLENFFGTDPSVKTGGLIAVRGDGNSFIFTHPRSTASATDLIVTFEWSTDMQEFHPAGSSNPAGTTTVVFTPSENTPSPGMTTVTAQLSGSIIPQRFFVRLSVVESDEM